MQFDLSMKTFLSIIYDEHIFKCEKAQSYVNSFEIIAKLNDLPYNSLS
jgi:hypothetical protein